MAMRIAIATNLNICFSAKNIRDTTGSLTGSQKVGNCTGVELASYLLLARLSLFARLYSHNRASSAILFHINIILALTPIESTVIISSTAEFATKRRLAIFCLITTRSHYPSSSPLFRRTPG
jgi:hypothetical protein